MLLAELVAASDSVASTSSRKEKVAILAAAVAALDVADLAVGVSYLAGVVPQGAIGVGYASLQKTAGPAATPTLALDVVDGALTTIAGISGPGSAEGKVGEIDRLFGAATRPEQRFLSALLLGGLRQGASERVMIDAVAKASGVPAAMVRRAVMFTGDIGEVAVAARERGRDGVAGFRLRVFRPVLPMLAKTAASVDDALESLGEAAVERKLDGARIQVHVGDGEVRVFTRNLNDVTERLPEVVAVAAELPVISIVLDGEAIAIGEDGRPSPFQVTMSRFGSAGDGAKVELRPFFFDVLHLNGEDVVDLDTVARMDLIDELIPEECRVPRLLTAEPQAATAFFAETIAAGHEGVMLKSLDAAYEAGRRGAGWLKVKPVHTLDLVVLGVEWGSGRRRGWLSNIHLGARGPDGSFVMLGKTFKGMTDSVLRWQTERFLELETHREGHVVFVRPEQVVEIAFDGVQRSTRYPGGMALRFARVKGYREDKSAEQADTIDTVRAILDKR